MTEQVSVQQLLLTIGELTVARDQLQRRLRATEAKYQEALEDNKRLRAHYEPQDQPEDKAADAAE